MTLTKVLHTLAFTSSVQLKLCLLHTRVVQKALINGAGLWPSEVNRQLRKKKQTHDSRLHPFLTLRALIPCDSFCWSWKQRGGQKVNIFALLPHRFVSGLAMNLSPLVERQFVKVFLFVYFLCFYNVHTVSKNRVERSSGY